MTSLFKVVEQFVKYDGNQNMSGNAATEHEGKDDNARPPHPKCFLTNLRVTGATRGAGGGT